MSWGGGVIAENLGWGVIEEGWRKGPWTAEEDRLLIENVQLHGEGRWNSVARLAGLKRNGKSCRLRWVNYLRPDLKRGQITPHEESIILELHARWGNRWSTIARSLPGRTDNEIKNYWRTHFKKKGKTSREDSAKLKARLLRRQQFQQQLQQQNQMDMKKIVSFLEENENKVPYIPQVAYMPQMRQEGTTELEHAFIYPMFNGSYATVPDQSPQEDVLWDGLWNLDDFHGNFCSASAVARASLQSLHMPLS